MADTKTMTFDASQWKLVPKVPTGEMLIAGNRKTNYGIASDVYSAMVTAAPTPAAQSAGQEAVALHDDRLREIAREFIDEGHSFGFGETVFMKAMRRALDAQREECAAPVNGGECDDARRMRTLCRLLDAADDLGNGFPGEVHHAFQEGAKVVRDTLDRFALPEDDEQLHASDCAVHNMPAYPNGTCNCERAADAPQVDAELLAVVHELVDAVAPYAYPTPDKTDTVWAKLERVRATLSKARGEQV